MHSFFIGFFCTAKANCQNVLFFEQTILILRLNLKTRKFGEIKFVNLARIGTARSVQKAEKIPSFEWSESGTVQSRLERKMCSKNLRK